MPAAAIPSLLPLPGGGPPVSADPEVRLKRLCQDFESLFLYKLMERMRATIPQEGYLHSAQEDIYNAICDQQVALALARSGGIGLGRLLYEQLSAKDHKAPPAQAAKAYEAAGMERGGQDGARALR